MGRAMDLRPQDERVLRMARWDRSTRRLRKISVQILAAIVVVVTLVPVVAAVPSPVLVLLLAAALASVVWAGYWSGVDRGLDALERSGAAQRFAEAEERDSEVARPEQP